MSVAAGEWVHSRMAVVFDSNSMIEEREGGDTRATPAVTETSVLSAVQNPTGLQSPNRHVAGGSVLCVGESHALDTTSIVRHVATKRRTSATLTVHRNS